MFERAGGAAAVHRRRRGRAGQRPADRGPAPGEHRAGHPGHLPRAGGGRREPVDGRRRPRAGPRPRQRRAAGRATSPGKKLDLWFRPDRTLQEATAGPDAVLTMLPGKGDPPEKRVLKARFLAFALRRAGQALRAARPEGLVVRRRAAAARQGRGADADLPELHRPGGPGDRRAGDHRVHQGRGVRRRAPARHGGEGVLRRAEVRAVPPGGAGAHRHRAGQQADGQGHRASRPAAATSRPTTTCATCWTSRARQAGCWAARAGRRCWPPTASSTRRQRRSPTTGSRRCCARARTRSAATRSASRSSRAASGGWRPRARVVSRMHPAAEKGAAQAAGRWSRRGRRR